MAIIRTQTKITPAKSDSISLRSTVPKEIVQVLDLKKGDIIEWTVEIEDNKPRVVVFKKN